MSSPANLEAEQTLLGAALVDPASVPVITDKLELQDFSSTKHGEIFAAIARLFAAGRGIDLITLKDELARVDSLEHAGGPAYLASLMDGLPRILNVDHWVEIVKHKSVMRRLIAASRSIEQRVIDSTGPDEAMDAALAAVMSVTDRSSSSGFATPADSAKEGIAELEDMIEAKGGLTGLASGLESLDAATGGMKPQELIVVAARPGMGKTALGMTIGDWNARQGKRVLFFSLEMSRRQLTARRFILRTRKTARELRQKKDYESLARAFDNMSKDPLWIDDSPSLTVSQVRARCRRAVAEKGKADLVVVDFLQLLKPERLSKRQEEVAEVARGLKNLAKELETPVLALCQLSRAVEGRDDHIPQLSDLRESGEIEQSADVVILIYRPRYYAANSTEQDELIIAKQRNGPVGKVRVVYHDALMLFEDLPQFPAPAADDLLGEVA